MIPAIYSIVIAIVSLALFPKTENRYFKVSLLTSFYGLLCFILLQSLTSNIGSPDSYEYSKLLDKINKQELKIQQASLIILFTLLLLSCILSYFQVLNVSKKIYRIVLAAQVLLTLLTGYIYILSGAFII